MGEAKGAEGLKIINRVHPDDKNIPMPPITRIKRRLEGINDVNISRRDALSAGADLGMIGLLAATGFNRSSRNALRNAFHVGTPRLTPSQENNTTTKITPEKLDFQPMDPETLFKSQWQADFSEIKKHDYTFRKWDENQVFQDSDTPEIHLVTYIFMGGLTGNLKVDEDTGKAIDAVRFRRGEPTSEAHEVLIRETDVAGDEVLTAVPVKSKDPNYPNEWWIIVGGQDVNGRPLVHAIDPHNRLIPKAEDGSPYLLYDNFVKDATISVPE